jgi:hypothetical protein
MRLYIDSNIISVYCAFSPQIDKAASHQWVSTQALWLTAERLGVRLLTSTVAVEEASAGGTGASHQRLNALRKVTVHRETSAMRRRVKSISALLPEDFATAAEDDIRHFSAACSLKADLLVTRNLKHFLPLVKLAAQIPHPVKPPEVLSPLDAVLKLGHIALANPKPKWIADLRAPSSFVQKFIDRETRAGHRIAKRDGLTDLIKELHRVPRREDRIRNHRFFTGKKA